MKVTISHIQIHPVIPQNGLVGFASFVLNNSLFLSSIGIMTRPSGGYRLTYPTKKICNKDIGIFYPIHSDLGKEIEAQIIKKYINLSGVDHATT